MAQKPLAADETGKAPVISTRIPKAQLAAMERTLQQKRLKQAEFTRLCLAYGLRHIDDVLALRDSEIEVTSQAS